MTQKERMLAGQLYLVDEELAAEMRHTAGVLWQFNSEPEPEVRAALLRGRFEKIAAAYPYQGEIEQERSLLALADGKIQNIG